MINQTFENTERVFNNLAGTVFEYSEPTAVPNGDPIELAQNIGSELIPDFKIDSEQFERYILRYNPDRKVKELKNEFEVAAKACIIRRFQTV